MILNSDDDAWVAMSEVPPDNADQDWYVRRVAVKLAGTLAMCLDRKEKLDWDTLRHSAEYHQDLEDSLAIFREYWKRAEAFPNEEQIDEQMQRAAAVAIDCIGNHKSVIAAVAQAAEGKDRLSRAEIVSEIQRSQQGA